MLGFNFDLFRILRCVVAPAMGDFWRAKVVAHTLRCWVDLFQHAEKYSYIIQSLTIAGLVTEPCSVFCEHVCGEQVFRQGSRSHYFLRKGNKIEQYLIVSRI